MTEKEMSSLALELGFSHAAFVSTEDLTFVPSFRPLCAENVCGKYGANYACPPDCGTVEEMKERVLRYPRALVLQTRWDIADPMDETQTKTAKGWHNRMTCQFMERMEHAGLMVGAGGCDLCQSCAIREGEPCRFPNKMFSCMSAYCIYVKGLCDHCGMTYDCGEGVVAFFSMICFDPAAET